MNVICEKCKKEYDGNQCPIGSNDKCYMLGYEDYSGTCGEYLNTPEEDE